jgi:deoxyribodipyrimidine photo-lyase
MPPIVVWIRQCLRLQDNPLFQHALRTSSPIVPVFILPASQTESELNYWQGNTWGLGDASRWWLHHSLNDFSEQLADIGSRLLLAKGTATVLLPELMNALGSHHLITDRGWTPETIQQEQALAPICKNEGWQFDCLNTHLLANPETLRMPTGKPYQVFSPYWKFFQKNAQISHPVTTPSTLPFPQDIEAALADFNSLCSLEALELLPKYSWADGFSTVWTPGERGALKELNRFIGETSASEHPVQHYTQRRDIPGIVGTSRLSPHLHFGEISPTLIWESVQKAVEQSPQLKPGADCYLRELGWREFAHSLFLAFPETAHQPLRKDYEAFPWEPSETYLKAWQTGCTGYPLVDAGMRELWHTGWMHNRIRMVVASFLVKHLLQPWQEGAQWFWDTLVDADLPNNTLGWQWAAGCGADAAPYFRIFNPILQSKKFDANGTYIRKWVPEIAKLPDEWIHTPWEAPPLMLHQAGVQLGETYPHPIVDHNTARQKALAALSTLKSLERV